MKKKILTLISLTILLLAMIHTSPFYQQDQITRITDNTITLRRGRPIHFDETLQVFLIGDDILGIGNLQDWASTAGEAHEIVQTWIEQALSENIVNLSPIEDIETGARAIIIGNGRIGRRFATAIIINSPQPPIDITTLNFLGAPASRGEEHWVYIYFPNISFNLKDLNETILLDWIATNEHIFPEFESARLSLTNGHELRLSRGNIRYFVENELRYLGYQAENEFRWMNAQTGKNIPSPFID